MSKFKVGDIVIVNNKNRGIITKITPNEIQVDYLDRSQNLLSGAIVMNTASHIIKIEWVTKTKLYKALL